MLRYMVTGMLGVFVLLQGLIINGQDNEESDLDVINEWEQSQGKDSQIDSSQNTPKSIQSPSIQSPSIQAPSIQSPSIQSPSIQAPSIQSPSIQSPSIQSPSIIEEQVLIPSNTTTSLDDIIPEKDPCSCVKYFLCDIDNGQVIDNGDVVGLIDIRLGGLTKGSPCDHYLDICCKQMKDSDDRHINQPSFQHGVCGKRNVGGVGFRITGAMDGEAQFGEFPWMAAIVKQESHGDKPPLNIFLCGGSLIHPKVILTVAHCVFGKIQSELKVRLGEWDTQTPEELYPHQDKLVTKIIVHENYYAGALHNDVALLFLDEEVKFAPNVDTICLPPPNINFDGQRCFASGWGKDSFGEEGRYQVILKKLELPVVPRRACQTSLRQTRLGPYFRLDESFVCAGGEPGRDTCRGDGGSPLVCKLPDSSSYAQFGIVAWGIRCGEKDTPGVYVNIPKFVPWIDEKLTANGLDTKYYKPSSS